MLSRFWLAGNAKKTHFGESSLLDVKPFAQARTYPSIRPRKNVTGHPGHEHHNVLRLQPLPEVIGSKKFRVSRNTIIENVQSPVPPLRKDRKAEVIPDALVEQSSRVSDVVGHVLQVLRHVLHHVASRVGHRLKLNKRREHNVTKESSSWPRSRTSFTLNLLSPGCKYRGDKIELQKNVWARRHKAILIILLYPSQRRPLE